MAQRKLTNEHGTFDDIEAYRRFLISKGYTFWNWQNGWSEDTRTQWREKIALSTEKPEDVQWNDTGSSCTQVYHDIKIFSHIDMGD